jgi:hypothetical protein
MMVEGRNVKLYVYRSGVPVLTVCATNVTRRETVETINITTVDSGRENEYIGGATDAEITLEGVRTISQLADFQVSDFEVGDVYRIIIIYTDASGSTLSYDGNVLITGIDDSNGAGEFSTYTVSMLRSGPWLKLFNVSGILVDGFGNPILDGEGNYIFIF